MTQLVVQYLNDHDARRRYERQTGNPCPTDLDAAWAQASGIERREPDRTPLDLLCAVSVAGCAAGVTWLVSWGLELPHPVLGMAITFTLAGISSWRHFRALPE